MSVQIPMKIKDKNNSDSDTGGSIMQRISKRISISKHKGNMATVVVFSLLVIVLIVAMLSWTFSMQSTLQRRAERSTAQYTAVSCTTLMSNAVIRDLCEMTAGKDRGILPNDIDGYNEMLKNIQNNLFPDSKYAITDPRLVVVRQGNEVLRTEVKDEMEKQLKGAELSTTISGDLKISESDPRNILKFQGMDRAYLQPFMLDVTLKMGTFTVHQTYSISNLAVTFQKNGSGLYARFDNALLESKLESQWIDTAEISITEPAN